MKLTNVMNEQLFGPGELLYGKDEINENIFFIVNGRINIT